MTPTHVLLIASLTWLVWIPAAVFEKRARGDAGGVSIFPVVPAFPLVAWGIAYLLDLLSWPVGVVVTGVAHLVLLAVFLVGLARSALAVRRSAKVEPPA